MKTSIQWLSDYLPGESNPQALADALTFGGLPVEVIETHGDDTVIDVEVTSNRGDCLSHAGVARELAALLNRAFKPLQTVVTEVTTPASSVCKVEIEDLALCPYYGARVIRNVKIGPSPAWMTKRLEAVGLRSINNVVDCTNYVMLELGQPLHAFDFDRVPQQHIVVRNARAGETLTTLDGHNRKLTADMLCICDAQKPIALAGVMGGLESEVSGATTNVLLESAQFAPLSIRKTARGLTMKSDASYRFERGIDPALSPIAALRCAQLIVQTAGGEVLAGIASAGSANPPVKTLSLRLSKLRQVLGVEISKADSIAALSRLQLRPMDKGDSIECTIPSYRGDLNIEVDLVEEVARVVGYQHIPVRESIQIQVTPPELNRKAEEKIRQSLIGSGFFEAVTFSFATDGLAELFAPAGVSLCRADPGTRKADNKLRPSILTGLLEAVRRNESVGVAGARVFEMGSTFWHKPDGTIDERRRLGFAGACDYRTLRGAAEAVLTALDSKRPIEVRPAQAPGFAHGSTGEIFWGGQRVGVIGIVTKAVAEKLDLRHTTAAAELELAAMVDSTQHVPQLTPLPKFPAVRRDLSLVVGDNTRFAAIRSIVDDQKLDQLEDVEYVTTYRGKPLEKTQKSVTITLVFRSPAGTLTSEAVDTAVGKVVAAAKDKLGASLRT
jgi:phenylalanyl-tRNA synthetase beta chain